MRGRVVAKLLAWRRLIIVLVFVAGLVTVFALGLDRYLSIDTLRQHREALRSWAETSGVLAALIFMAGRYFSGAFSLPRVPVLWIAGSSLLRGACGGGGGVRRPTLRYVGLF